MYDEDGADLTWLSGARLADTPTFAQINAVAVEAGHFSVTDDAIADLDPAGEHVGVACYIWGADGFTPVLRGDGPLRLERVPRDGWAFVTWAAARRQEDLFAMFMAVRLSAFYGLPEAPVRARAEERLVEVGREYLTRVLGPGGPAGA